jgi:hypothetical protein
LKRARDKLGHPPSCAEFRALDTDISYSAIAQEFDGWVNAKEAAGFDVNTSPNRTYTLENINQMRRECLTALRNISEELDHPPTLREFCEADNEFSRRQIDRLFGSWNHAKRAADVEVTQYAKIPNRRKRARDALKKAADELGHSPTVAEYAELDTPISESVVRDEFGSWPAAQRAAGLDVTDPSAISREDCLNAIRDVADTVNGSPTVKQFREQDTDVSLTAIKNRFGSWTAAKRAAEVDR